MQSPIDIVENAQELKTMRWSRSYGSTTLDIAHHEHVEEIINNGHTIQVTCDGLSTLTIGDVVYSLKQFHFHTPSEHHIQGRSFPMEMHLVHRSADGHFAVVAVLYEEKPGAQSIFDRYLEHLPSEKGQRRRRADVTIDINTLLPSNDKAYHYVGSFTTPPCTEDVQWLVLGETVPISPEVIAAFSSRIGPNNRPIQATNGRNPTLFQVRE
jgi:carbonic anhydrase